MLEVRAPQIQMKGNFVLLYLRFFNFFIYAVIDEDEDDN